MGRYKDVFDNVKQISQSIALYGEHMAQQRFSRALKSFQTINQCLGNVMDWLVQERQILDQGSFFEMLNNIAGAFENKDYVLVGDLLQQLLLPVMNCAINDLYTAYDREEIGILPEKTIREGIYEYAVEYNNSGEATLVRSNGGNRIYYNTNLCAKLEGARFATAYADSEVDEYIILGLGLGYHAYALDMKGFGARITVYESSKAVIRLWEEFGAKADFDVVWDEGYRQLSARLTKATENTSFLIHWPTLCAIDNENVRTAFEDYFWVQNSVKEQKAVLEWNFRNNMKLGLEPANNLKEKLENRDVILVAAGPSLDKDIRVLADRAADYTIVAVGTVYKKLLSQGIVPDYVVISDVTINMQKQLLGTDNTDSVLIALASANHKAVKEYAGRKYIAYQEGYDKAEEKACETGVECYQTGGSVACLAMDLVLRMGATKIVCLGYDLAYTDGKSHAAGTAFYNEKKGSRQVVSVDGRMIETAPNFEIYRKWIEARIAGCGVTIINTAKGAKIEGMVNMSISDALNE